MGHQHRYLSYTTARTCRVNVREEKRIKFAISSDKRAVTESQQGNNCSNEKSESNDRFYIELTLKEKSVKHMLSLSFLLVVYPSVTSGRLDLRFSQSVSKL